MVKLNSKCPKCGKGVMKLIPKMSESSPRDPLVIQGRARCTECDYEDTATGGSGD